MSKGVVAENVNCLRNGEETSLVDLQSISVGQVKKVNPLGKGQNHVEPSEAE